MSPSELFLAAMMLSAPVGTPEQVPPPERWYRARPRSRPSARSRAAVHATSISDSTAARVGSKLARYCT